MAGKDSESDRPTGEQPEAKPELANGSGDKPTSGDSNGQPDVDLQGLLTTVRGLVATVKTLQSEKDRGVQSAKDEAAQARQEAENLKGQIEKVLTLAQKGMDAEGIVAELGKTSIEDQLAGLTEKVDRILGLGTLGTASSPTADQRKVIEEIGLKEDDQAVVAALRQGLKGDALRAVLAMAALKQAKRPSPGASSASPMDGGGGEKDDYDVTDIEDSDKLYKLAAKKEFGG
jgi:outer membrane murein-binding lipoprotein Lpp